MPRGAFIVFEGGDRSGKTTQAKKVSEYFTKEGIKYQSIRFPNRTSSIGTVIDQYLKKTKEADDHTIHLLFSANRWEQNADIIKSLESGETIICDRYAYSGVAFSAAKGLDLEWCKQPDVGLARPDLVLLFDVTEEQAKERGDFGKERYEVTEFQQKVKEKFNELYDEEYFQRIDAGRSIDEVFETVIAAVKDIQKKVTEESRPLRLLWTGK